MKERRQEDLVGKGKVWDECCLVVLFQRVTRQCLFLISRPAQFITFWRHRPSHFGSFSIDNPEGYFSPFCLLCTLTIA
jgi:hypothetical protein